MDNLLKQIFDKISSYNIFNNLYPGAVFCYLLKIMIDINIILSTWYENLILFYFVGMVISRVGSVIIEPIMKKIKIKNKKLLQFSSYADYRNACENDPLVGTLSEVNNTYRTLLSCIVCIFALKIGVSFNDDCMENQFTFFNDNKEWIILIILILLFAFSYVKQTSYVKNRVENVVDGMGDKK